MNFPLIYKRRRLAFVLSRTGFEALVKTEEIGSFTALDIEPATIDEIVVFTSKKGEDYE